MMLYNSHPPREKYRTDIAVRYFYAARHGAAPESTIRTRQSQSDLESPRASNLLRKSERIVNHLKAIIMAGGEGSRLRPLTCDCPKPMLRLMGKPLMEHAIRLLQKYGIHEIGATLGYQPDAIMDYFGDGEALGASLRYYIENVPLGTAGSVRRAKDFLDERFIVLSGDGVTDFDLSEAIRFHESRKALATLVLVKSGTPQEYGMVVTDPDGRITAFHEKPGRSDIYSDRINTGI